MTNVHPNREYLAPQSGFNAGSVLTAPGGVGYPTMTLTADSKKRVVLPGAALGDAGAATQDRRLQKVLRLAPLTGRGLPAAP